MVPVVTSFESALAIQSEFIRRANLYASCEGDDEAWSSPAKVVSSSGRDAAVGRSLLGPALRVSLGALRGGWRPFAPT